MAGPGPGSPVRHTGSMAHRKGLLTAQVARWLAFTVFLAALMAGRVVLLNQMTSMRADIATLQDRKGFLETKSASLQERWNRATSAAVVAARAESELGLINPDLPSLALVKLQPEAKGRTRWTWPSWLDGIAGPDVAEAAEVVVPRQDGRMVHLSPVPRAGDAERRSRP